MNALDIVRAAIPNADKGLADAIVWGRTIFPVGPVSARDLYHAAARFRRAGDHGVTLCDWCDRKTDEDERLCARCENALRRASHEADDEG